MQWVLRLLVGWFPGFGRWLWGAGAALRNSRCAWTIFVYALPTALLVIVGLLLGLLSLLGSPVLAQFFATLCSAMVVAGFSISCLSRWRLWSQL